MIRQTMFIDQQKSSSRSSLPVLYLPGAMLVFLGILILVVPELLAALVAAVLIFCGICLIGLGWSARRFSGRFFQMEQTSRYP